MANTLDVIKARTSANQFDTTHTLSEAEITELVQYAQEAPTSFNMQNWRIVAFASKEQKEKLKAVAYGQPKVADAAVCFLFVGIKDGYKQVGPNMKPLVEAGVLPEDGLAGLVGMADGMYAGKESIQRDEAIRSASFAAMTLMFAAQDKGYVSGPMIGFDFAAVAQLAGLGENEVPVLLLSVGKAAEGNWPRKPRVPVAQQLKIV